MAGGELQTRRMCISEKPTDAQTTIKFIVSVDTSMIPATIYDLYIWLGPFVNGAADEYYDILDSLLPPLEIRERGNLLNAHTIVGSELLKVEAC
jgi:hypothetical protein